MHGINKVILVGCLGRDPEIKYTAAQKIICNLSLATTSHWRDKNTNEYKQETDWHQIVLFNKLAEIAGEYLIKGAKIYIEGNLKTQKYTDKNNIERYRTKIIGQVLQIIDGKKQLNKTTHQKNGNINDDTIPF